MQDPQEDNRKGPGAYLQDLPLSVRHKLRRGKCGGAGGGQAMGRPWAWPGHGQAVGSAQHGGISAVWAQINLMALAIGTA